MFDLKRAPEYPKIQSSDSTLSDFEYSPPEPPTVQSEQKLQTDAEYLYSVARFRDCSEVLKTICKEYPGNRRARSELTRTIFRLLEQQRGTYNFTSLYAEVATRPTPQLDHATYVGSVEVRVSEGKDRGLFTTSQVKAGDLLVCEKAFSYGFSKYHRGTNMVLREATIKKLTEYPNLIATFSSIYHGSYEPLVAVDGGPFVDQKLVDRVIALNSFGGSLTSLASHMSNPSGHSSGIWILAASINHSCVANCRRSFIGDMQIIRACRDMPPNTELLWPYTRPAAQDHDYEATQQELQEYGFVCVCELCEDAKATGTKSVKRRELLRVELSAAFATGGQRGAFECGKVDTARIERTLALLACTYSSTTVEVPRTGMWDPYLALTRIYVILGRSHDAISSTLKVFEMLGFVIRGAQISTNGSGSIIVEKWGLMVDYLVECWMILWTAYAALGDLERAEITRELAVVSYGIIVGEDQTFEETYGSKGSVCVVQRMLWSMQ